MFELGEESLKEHKKLLNYLEESESRLILFCWKRFLFKLKKII